MSRAKNLVSGKTLPNNPTWIAFERSDGNSSRWPPNILKPDFDSDGHINWMRAVNLDESSAVYWRCQVATEVAKRLNKPAGPSYVLKSWPEGYQMYDHQKGHPSKLRHDPYLIGSENVYRFRSAAEFIPHALWLLTDPTLDRKHCLCKYCSRTPQRTVSVNLGLSPGRIAKGSGGRAQRADLNALRVYAAVRRVAEPRVRERVRVSQGPQQFMVVERERDLRAAVSSKGLATRRYGREGELVWCALNVPIAWDENAPMEQSITFWPGLIQEVRLKTHIQAQPASGGGNDVQMSDGTNAAPNGSMSEATKTNHTELPFTVTHATVYKVKFLALSSAYVVPDTQVVPYQSYVPPDDLLRAVQSACRLGDDPPDVPMNDDDDDDEPETAEQRLMYKFSKFQPLPDPSTTDSAQQDLSQRFRDGAGAFALAIEIASCITKCWTPTDEWKLMKSFPGAQRLMADVASEWTLARYQGLWWGAERIWMDDLVRLKVGRNQLTLDASGIVKKPAPPSASTKRFAQMQGEENAELVAAGRGVFMQVDGIFVEQVEGPGGRESVKECRMSGMLYELVDEDWADPDDLSPAHKPVDIKGKGKAREMDADESFGTFHLPMDTDPSTSTPPGPRADASNSDTQLPHAASPAPPPTSAAALRAAHLLAAQSKTAPAAPSPTTSCKPCVLAAPPLAPTPSLPPAPLGFRFRPLLPPTHEAAISLTLLAGRYYPSILTHPALRSSVVGALDNSSLASQGYLWALEGLTCGVYNSIDPVAWKPGRLLSVREADVKARKALINWWRMKAEVETEAPMAQADVVPVHAAQ